ncbi:L,D-transpeptidase family protein [Carboxylicivirga taeanensis]|uniref:L,D-transpeptidase family protein n=1 Tax=Carboxylicivirga taeanensis TaxID=1416875 RepID=UPI003F6E2C1D
MRLAVLGIIIIVICELQLSPFNWPMPLQAVPGGKHPAQTLPVDSFIARLIHQLDTHEQLTLAGHKLFSNPLIKTLYIENSYAPIWLSRHNQLELVQILEDASYDGLTPNDYHHDIIANYIADPIPQPEHPGSYRAFMDLLMTDAALSYTHHLTHGKVNQNDTTINWDYSLQPTPDKNHFNLKTALQRFHLRASIDSTRSQLGIYKGLKQLLIHYNAAVHTNTSPPFLSYPPTALKKGDSLPDVALLKERLLMDDYPITSKNDLFDEELKQALVSYQLHNGLPADGIANQTTYTALNVSAQEKIDRLRSNLERVRWLDNSVPDTFILINIASYTLQLIESDSVKFSCHVIVGTKHTPTPVFSSYIRYIVLNPTWYIPHSIATNEILPALKTDSLYLQKRNMVLMQGAKEVDPSKTDFSVYTASNFPYTILQKPGPNNALGQIKFILPNKYSVYLHDTPTKSLFGESSRAFSHGCIRVEKPIVLAELLLKEQGYTRQSIEDYLKDKQSKTIVLNNGVPTLIIYLTCDATPHATPYFFNDVYQLDKKLVRQLNRKREQ